MASTVRNDAEAALQRAEHLQALEYGVRDTLEQSRQALAETFKILPGVALSFSDLPRDESYAFVYDIAAFDFRKMLASPHSTQAVFGGCYYMCSTYCPDFMAMRKGVVLLREASNFDWRKNLDLATIRKMWTELLMGKFTIGGRRRPEYSAETQGVMLIPSTGVGRLRTLSYRCMVLSACNINKEALRSAARKACVRLTSVSIQFVNLTFKSRYSKP